MGLGHSGWRVPSQRSLVEDRQLNRFVLFWNLPRRQTLSESKPPSIPSIFKVFGTGCVPKSFQQQDGKNDSMDSSMALRPVVGLPNRSWRSPWVQYLLHLQHVLRNAPSRLGKVWFCQSGDPWPQDLRIVRNVQRQ
jgi:hypothetical protein